ncbi:outer membrane protein [Bacteroidales bacterium KA00251]|nr:outer membrane protein [Bacteroidales bacterium KA00251]
MKKTAFYLLLVASLIFVGCTNSQKKNEDSGAANTNVEENASIDRPLKIAYVRLDSVLNNYKGYKEMSKKLEAKASANQNLLSSKEQNLQREMNAFNQKLQSGGFVNELAAQQEYEKIQKKGLLAQQQASQIADTFLKEQQHYNDSLNNIILKEVEKYNQDKGYDLILNTVQMSGVIYGKPELDITNEIIERLNASYSSSKK